MFRTNYCTARAYAHPKTPETPAPVESGAEPKAFKRPTHQTKKTRAVWWETTQGVCGSCVSKDVIVQDAPDASKPARLHRFRLSDLQEQFPEMPPPVVDGLFREAETVNLVSASKSGKSWMAYGLLFAVATGRPWFGRFPTRRGRALLVDNELQKETLAYRLRTVQDALGIPDADVADAFEVLPLRGRLPSLEELREELEKIPAGEFRIIILDAKYRLNSGASEIDNAAETDFYNTIDRIAERTRASIVLIHHSSKGDQSAKEVTDVGSGAGAQSRAADCHLVIRAHEVPDHAVLESRVRNFKPVPPLPLRWEFPLWVPAKIDPQRLKGKRTSKDVKAASIAARDQQAVLAAIREKPSTKNELIDATGLSKMRVRRAVAELMTAGSVTPRTANRFGNDCDEYHPAGGGSLAV
jgi:hypothetical protein